MAGPGAVEVAGQPIPLAPCPRRPDSGRRLQEITRRTALVGPTLDRSDPGVSHSAQRRIPRNEQVVGSIPLSGSIGYSRRFLPVGRPRVRGRMGGPKRCHRSPGREIAQRGCVGSKLGCRKAVSVDAERDV